VRDLYEILGVARDAELNAIRKAYRKLARKHHPDLNPGDKAAEERFKEISRAWEVLEDPERRRNYDEFGAISLEAGFDAEKAREAREAFGSRSNAGRPGAGASRSSSSAISTTCSGVLSTLDVASGAATRACAARDRRPRSSSTSDAVRGGEHGHARAPTAAATDQRAHPARQTRAALRIPGKGGPDQRRAARRSLRGASRAAAPRSGARDASSPSISRSP
jgi:curved DNA-binding protein CbpA